MRKIFIGLLALCAAGAVPEAMAAEATAGAMDFGLGSYSTPGPYSAQSPQTVYGYESDPRAARNAMARNVPPALAISGSSGRTPNVRFNGAVPQFDDDLTPQASDLPATGPTSPSGMGNSAVNSR